jgi:Zn-dependent M16 (insulinase) family peptidase
MRRNLVSNRFIKDLSINCFHYCYDNGLNVIYVDDENYTDKVDINITILTPAIDNKGITHIIEHCIASEINNKKFLKQYASTVQDKTSYEYILHIDDVTEIEGIINEIFFPKFKTDKNILLREGWRIDCENGKNFIRGIVYNEMLESFASPMYNIINYIPYTLFSTSIYKNIAGGVPNDILDLRLEDLINYHTEYYKINNCVIYVHGCECIDSILNMIESTNQKCSYGQINGLVQTETKKNVNKCNLKINYPTIKDKDNSFISINYVIKKPRNQFEYNVYCHLVNFIIENQEKLKKEVKDTKLLNNVQATFKNLVFISYFTVILRGENANNHILIKEYKKFFVNIMESFTSESILNYINYHIMHNNIIDGLNLGKYIMEAFFSNLDPFIYLYNDMSKEQGNIFIKSVKEQLVKSPISSKLLVIPKKEWLRANLIEKAMKNGIVNEYKIEKKITSHLYSSIWEKSIEKYKNNTIDLESIKYKYIKLSHEHNIDCYIYNSSEFSNIHFYFDIKNFHDEQFVYLNIIVNYLQNEIKLTIKNVIKLFIYPVNNKECKLVLRISATEKDLESVMNSLMNILSLEDLEKHRFMIEDIINRNLVDFEMDIFRNPIFYLEARRTSYISLESFCKEYSFGIGNYKFINNIKEFNIIYKLKNILKMVLVKNNLKVSIYTKDEEHVLNLIKNFIDKLEEGSKETLILQKGVNQSEGLIYSFETNYIAQSFNLKTLSHKNYGKNSIISNIIKDTYFLPMIRERNNAYGCGVINKEDAMTFYSIRDPNIESTLVTFKNTYDYMVRNIDLIYNEYELYRRNFIYSITDPVITKENDRITLKTVFLKKFKYRSDVIKETENIDKKYILELSDMIREGVDQNLYSIIGNEKDIKDNISMFSKIDVLI